MNPERFARLRSIVLEAEALPEVEREAFLRRACEEDDELLTEARDLLARGAAAPSVVRTGRVHDYADELLEGAESRAERELPESVGPYRVQEVLGKGGMGVVYRAEQEEPLRRTVAVKIIRAGLDSESVLTRFEAERRTLALLSHPNIARVYDAGSADSGRPYFAMEYVDGPRITSFCDEHRLTTEERLELFERVCDGVQHAHRKGIIHRDIKPSNVLVERSNGSGVPKIIDFGIAKAIDPEAGGPKEVTRFGMVVGTPEYMSPEQADPELGVVDTRTDVYALGVLLYEMLVGLHPIDPDVLERGNVDEIRQRIREDEPSRPSSRATGSSETSTDLASRRRTEPAALARRLRGDLDWVVMKALEKDPARRYGSPDELAADLRRHQRHEPVEAGPPGAAYQLRKFVRRRRGPLAAAAAVLIALIAGVVGTTTGMLRARSEAREARTQAAIAREVNTFVNADLLAAVDPERAGKDVTVREVLDASVARVEGRFSDAPLVEAEVRATIGSTYRSLGEYGQAERQLRRALELRTDTLGPAAAGTLDTSRLLAGAVSGAGRFPEAGELIEGTLETARRSLGEHDPVTLRAAAALVGHLEGSGRTDEALALGLPTLEAQRRILGESHRDALDTAKILITLYKHERLFDEAVELAGDTLESERSALGHEHPRTLATAFELADLYSEMGRAAESDRLFREVLDARRRVLGTEHPSTLGVASALAAHYMLTAREAEAEPLYTETLDTQRRVLGEEHPDTIQTLSNLAILYASSGRLDRAEPLFKEIRSLRRRTLGEEHPLTITAQNNVAILYMDTGRAEQAATLLEEILVIARRRSGEDDSQTLQAQTQLASVYGKLGRLDEAEDLYTNVLARRRAKLGDEHGATRNVLFRLGIVYRDQGRYDESEGLLLEALDIARRVDGESSPKTGNALWDVARLYAAAGRHDETREYLDLAMPIKREQFGADSANFKYHEARSLALVGDLDAALTALELAVEMGFARYRSILHEGDLEPLRDDQRFSVLLDEVQRRNAGS